MITEQSLRRDVLQYLRTNYSIRLDIPAHRTHYSDTISLRLFKSPLTESKHQNRYMLLIKESEELLKRNIVNTDRIKEFGENFFEIITQDILVLEGNEEIRKSFARIRDQITYRVEELGTEQKQIEEECKIISDRQQILTFLEGSFRGYLAHVRQVSQQYQTVNNVQVLTSINIDSLYSQRLGNEQDYIQHYQPLLQVMQRLKSNMIKLYKQLNGCEYFELPLRSVNFLANCKNLLLELQPFLIRNDCVFNRLIFHVVRGQKQNNRLIGRVYHANSTFSHDVISDIFKAFFLQHIFQDHHRAHRTRLEQQKELLMKNFNNQSASTDSFYGQMMKSQKIIAQLRVELQQLKNVIGMGKDKIMREYLGRNQCMKLKIVSELEVCCSETIKFSKNMMNLLKFKSRLLSVKERYGETDRNVKKTTEAIKQMQNANVKPTKVNLKQLNDQIDRKFQESYLMIQEGLLQLQQVRQTLQETRQEIKQPYFETEYFPKIQLGLVDVLVRYRDSQSQMLNSYQHLRKQKIAKTGQARQQIKQSIEQFGDYFQAKVIAEVGHQIRNEDAQCQVVKDYIIKIEKVQFLMSNYIGNQNRDEGQEISKYKINFQALLQIYEGSMDQRIFQSFIQKLNFQAQDWPKRVQKVKQLNRELARYVSTLKKLSSSAGNKFVPKVSKLIKNRTQLYEVLQDLYEEFVQIYETCMVGGHLNPSDHGLKLFDQASYKYTLMLYQYRNRTRAEVEELKDLLLPRRTLNYLLDDLFEPFLQIFRIYASYLQQELLTFTLRLEHALNYKVSHTEGIKMYEQTLELMYTQDFFPNVAKLSYQLLQLGDQNRQVLQLEREEVVVYNLKEFKEMALSIDEHVRFAEAVVRGLKQRELRMQVELSNRTLMILRQKLVGDWQQHRDDLQRTGILQKLDQLSPP